MWEYQRIKFEVASCQTILPKKEEVMSGTQNASRALSTREEKLVFIGDVEKFVKHYTFHYQPKANCPLPPICVREIFLFCLAEHVWLKEVFPRLNYEGTNMGDVKKVYMSYGQLAKRFKMHSIKQKKFTLSVIPRRLFHASNLVSICRDIREKAKEYFIAKKMIIE